MTNENYTKTFTVEQDADKVFNAITNVRGWWSEGIEGNYGNVGDRFTHRVQDIHRCLLEVKTLVPGSKVAWHVIDNHFSFTKDELEWIGTDIVFDIVRENDKTKVTLTHIGLVPNYECYEVCVDGWGTYMNSLQSLIATGKGQPNVGEAMNDSEERLLSESH